jgi:hypothetical protein
VTVTIFFLQITTSGAFKPVVVTVNYFLGGFQRLSPKKCDSHHVIFSALLPSGGLPALGLRK